VMNVFMCTGYTRDTHQYFMKASPVRPGDFIEFSPRLICWLRSLPAPAATAAPVTPTTLPNAIRSRSRSIGRARERWPAGSHRSRTNILARMEPGKGRLRLIRGSLELSDGPLRTAAVLYLPKVVSCTPASRPPLRYINRLFSATSGHSLPTRSGNR
jgi:hypothetical protein